MAEGTKMQVKARPLSPHLQIWRWHVTMATSILHRATGVANAVVLLLLLVWIASLAAGSQQYQTFQSLIGTLLGKIILFGCLVSVSYHIANGVRHLFFNLGLGLDKNTASTSGRAVIILGLIGGIVLMSFGYMAVGK